MWRSRTALDRALDPDGLGGQVGEEVSGAGWRGPGRTGVGDLGREPQVGEEVVPSLFSRCLSMGMVMGASPVVPWSNEVVSAAPFACWPSPWRWNVTRECQAIGSGGYGLQASFITALQFSP